MIRNGGARCCQAPRVTWDTDRLEQLASHPAYRATLAPLRRTTTTKPSVRIEIGDKRKGKGKE